MATPKPQIRGLFATPVCQHFHPIATEANAELRPIIIERAQTDGSLVNGSGWRSASDFESWGGAHAGTLLRVVRELAHESRNPVPDSAFRCATGAQRCLTS